jgi:hypothetical protein
MDENKEASSVSSIPKSARPSDVEVFLGLLPAIAGSLAQKHTDARTVRDLAIGVAREITGQLVSLGVCDRTTVCLDNQYLATPGPVIAASQPAPILGSNNGHGIQGAMVAHFETRDERKIPTL